MPVARPESSDARVIAHVDLDCFYVQVEQRKRPELRGQPTAVVQYNEWKGGALIAVSYEARKCGVKRSMRGDEAKEVCPEIQLVQVPVARGKADLSVYRSAGSEVVSVLSRKGRCERASIDEVYLDLTDTALAMLEEAPPERLEVIEEESLKSHILGITCMDQIDSKDSVKKWLCSSDAEHRDKLLACGILIVAELRMQVLKDTEFTCSAGIAHNKMLAKLASGMNKPAQQTVVPFSAVQGLLSSLPIYKMKQLGGKLGISLQKDLGATTVGDLLQFSVERLQKLYGINTGSWLWNIARGVNGEEVQGRLLPKSHGSGKLFSGPRALRTLSSVQHWLNTLCEDLNDRLCSDFEQNRRIAKTLTLHANAYKSNDSDSHKKFPSKSIPLRYGVTKIQDDAFCLFQAALREYMSLQGIKGPGNKHGAWAITSLSISASKMVEIPAGTSTIMRYFQGQSTYCFAGQLKENIDLLDSARSPSVSESYEEPQVLATKTRLSEEKDSLEGMQGFDEDKADTWGKLNPSCSMSQASDAKKAPLTTLTFSDHKKEGSIKKGNQRKKNVSRDKIQGVPSLLNFFKNHKEAESSQQPTHVGTFEESESFSSNDRQDRYQDLSAGSPTELQDEDLHKDAGLSSYSYKADHGERSQRWSYKVEEIDESVIAELPPEIQHEIKIWSSYTSCRRKISDHSASIDRDGQVIKRCGPEDRRKGTSIEKMDNIDPSVFNELPSEIQSEIRTWLRPQKRPNTVKGGSTIAHYFLPTKNIDSPDV